MTGDPVSRYGCFSCGQPSEWLITALMSEGTRAGRLMAYCTECRNQRIELIGVSLDLSLVGDRMSETLDYLYGIGAVTAERADAEAALGLS